MFQTLIDKIKALWARFVSLVKTGGGGGGPQEPL